MTKPQIIKLVEEIEDFVAGKIDMNTYHKHFPKVVKELSNRYIQPELVIDREK